MANDKPVQVKAWNEGWLQVKVPLPFSLRYVNSYVLPEPAGGYTVVDPGLHTPEAVAAWESAFEQEGIAFTDIKRIVVTHQHPDHYGLAGLFQERSGAPVWMTEASHSYAVRMWGEHRELGDKLVALFDIHGMPDELVEGVADNLESFLPCVSPQPSVTYMKAGDPFTFGGIEWATIDAPGHALGQILFYDPVSRTLLCGDQVMPDITPNVSLVPDELDDPLDAFMQSLELLSMLDVSMAFPGHRNPFPKFTERCIELKEHHERRLDSIVDLLNEQDRQPATGFELCELLFGTRHRENKHNLRFAMAETLAHLAYLVKRGRIAQVERDGKLFYSRADRQDGNVAY
ncbi:MBL fold metallo-hydrolase [Paenibacillus sp. MMS18-CY102]|uniref:MBL fold metallo-hydrolase n=1 Tax=Paenibacillus sp. MMS18-CY102 TaxID=2682849 RepID=UPI001365A621|nr:MBL fold metallo-hydrolase [Paenibacillus sp. MMS18-CY102]MWC28690.1 MBL fold metallo-hydrolase [Paenibacillus sp. MMS18-CY102]